MVAVALIRPDLTRGAVLELLAVWVVMAVLRLRDAIDLRDGLHVNALLAILALLAIAGGVGALVAPDDNLTGIMINVWIFTILPGVTRRPQAPYRDAVMTRDMPWPGRRGPARPRRHPRLGHPPRQPVGGRERVARSERLMRT